MDRVTATAQIRGCDCMHICNVAALLSPTCGATNSIKIGGRIDSWEKKQLCHFHVETCDSVDYFEYLELPTYHVNSTSTLSHVFLYFKINK